MKHQTVILSLLSVLMLTVIAFAQPGKGQRWGQKGERGSWMQRYLDLTAEQETKIEDLRLQNQRAMIPLRSKLESLQADLQLAMTAEAFDKSKTEKIVTEMQKVRTDMQMAGIMHHQTVREVLTPEQRKKFDAHLLSRKGFRGGRGNCPGRCCGHGPGFGQGSGGPFWADPQPDEN
jgi:Spy/CpxP family protein refolding chaperone